MYLEAIVDSISEQHSHLGDYFDDGTGVDGMPLPDLLEGAFGIVVRPRMHGETAALATPPPTTIRITPLEALRIHWSALSEGEKLGVVLVGGIVVLAVGGAITGALTAKAALGHAALAAVPLCAAAL